MNKRRGPIGNAHQCFFTHSIHFDCISQNVHSFWLSRCDFFPYFSFYQTKYFRLKRERPKYKFVILNFIFRKVMLKTLLQPLTFRRQIVLNIGQRAWIRKNGKGFKYLSITPFLLSLRTSGLERISKFLGSSPIEGITLIQDRDKATNSLLLNINTFSPEN